MALEIKEINSYDEFIGLKEPWNALLANSGADTVFLRHEWFDCWWKAFGKNNRMRVLAASEAGLMLGIAPLMMKNHAGPSSRVIEFIADSNSGRCDFIVAPGRADVVERMLSHLKASDGSRWDCLRLANIPADSWTISALAKASAVRNLRFGKIAGLRSPVISMGTTWEDYLETKSTRFSKTLRYCINKAHRLEQSTMEEITDVARAPDLVSTLAGISARSWKKSLAGDLARSPENELFFKELSIEASRQGWLSVWLLKAKAERVPVAYEYHLCYNNEEFALRADFDAAYASFSPGSALEAHIIQQAFGRGRNQYDLCGNDYAYKMRWTDTVHDHVTVEVFNRTCKGTCQFYLQHRLRPLARKAGLGRLKRVIVREGALR